MEGQLVQRFPPTYPHQLSRPEHVLPRENDACGSPEGDSGREDDLRLLRVSAIEEERASEDLRERGFRLLGIERGGLATLDGCFGEDAHLDELVREKGRARRAHEPVGD